MYGLVVVGVRNENVGVVVDVEQEVSIWLEMGGISNGSHVAEDNRCIKRISVCLMCRRWVVVRGIVGWGM